MRLSYVHNNYLSVNFPPQPQSMYSIEPSILSIFPYESMYMVIKMAILLA